MNDFQLKKKNQFLFQSKDNKFRSVREKFPIAVDLSIYYKADLVILFGLLLSHLIIIISERMTAKRKERIRGIEIIQKRKKNTIPS